jgi:hypothetical protein
MRSLRAILPMVVLLSCHDDESDRGQNASGTAGSTRLLPSAFPDLPAPVRADLEQRGCTIPQSYREKPPHNVVEGRFTAATQMDIAVLCLADTMTVILLYRGGSADSVAELAERPHAEYAAGDSTFTFDRAIDAADPRYIRERYERYGGPRPPPLDHDGINDIFVGKASTVLYWYGGRWLQLQGAD